MKSLDKKYQKELDVILKTIQGSDELAKYLDEEEEDDFLALRSTYEPSIAELYKKVADENPLQLFSFEQALLIPEFEGLYLPRILGFAILRGAHNDKYKYYRPQQQFKDILLAICNSANFDVLKKRIGQSVQIGFAMSSKIWVANLISTISNKRVTYYLENQKLLKYRDPDGRRKGLNMYKKQFVNDNYFSTEFPNTLSELKVIYPELKEFLIKRISLNLDNSSFISDLTAFIKNKEFLNTEEYVKVIMLYANFIDSPKADKIILSETINKLRKESPDFVQNYIDYLYQLFQTNLIVDKEANERVSSLLDFSIDDDLAKFYTLVNEINSKGFVHEETIESINKFYNNHNGMSTINACVRHIIFNSFAKFINSLMASDYAQVFDITKTLPPYLEIFSNQQFLQDIEAVYYKYTKKIIKAMPDKRGRDYQDYKKFVKTTLVELGLFTSKEVVEMFKTKRKKVAEPAKK